MGDGELLARGGREQRQPCIEVVVPVRNGGLTIGACVEALLAQHYPSTRYRVTIVDNGSTDATAHIVGSYPVRMLRCAVLGPAAARNVGVRQTDADIVAFTDADCVAHPDWLLELSAAFDDDAVAAAGGPIETLRRGGRGIVERFGEDCVPLRNYRSGDEEYLPHLYGANAAYRRDVLLRLGAWREDLLSGEDVELSWRVQMQTGVTAVYRPGAIVLHRHRITLRTLARQYWLYGLGEMLLDTLFKEYPAYSRDARFCVRRIRAQLMAMMRCGAWGVVRAARGLGGRSSTYDLAVPWLWLVIEGSNLAGKLRGLQLTRGLRSAEPLRRYIERIVPTHYTPAPGSAGAADPMQP